MALHDLARQLELAVGEEHCQLRPGQALAGRRHVGERGGAGQGLHLPVEPPLGDELGHEAGVSVQVLGGGQLLEAERQGLVIVVLEDVGGDLLCHRGQQGVAVPAPELAGSLRLAGQDLDVDLVVGAIDPGGIVYRVRVDAPAGARVGDAAGLGEAEICAFAHHGAAQLRRQHPDRIVGLVAHLRVAFAGSLHIGADAAQVEQLGRGSKHRLDQLGRRQGVVPDVQKRLDLRAQRYRLGGAREDPAAFGDQARVVVGPGRGGQLEQALALGP